MYEFLKIILAIVLGLVFILLISHLEIVTEYIFESSDSSEYELYNGEYKSYLLLKDWGKDSLLIRFTIVRKDKPLRVNNISCKLNQTKSHNIRFDNHYSRKVDTSSFYELSKDCKVIDSENRMYSYDFTYNKRNLQEEVNAINYEVIVNTKQFKDKLYFEENNNLKFVSGHGDPSFFIILMLIFIAFLLSIPVLSNIVNTED